MIQEFLHTYQVTSLNLNEVINRFLKNCKLVFIGYMPNMFRKSDVHLHQLILQSQFSQSNHNYKINIILYFHLRFACCDGL